MGRIGVWRATEVRGPGQPVDRAVGDHNGKVGRVGKSSYVNIIGAINRQIIDRVLKAPAKISKEEQISQSAIEFCDEPIAHKPATLKIAHQRSLRRIRQRKLRQRNAGDIHVLARIHLHGYRHVGALAAEVA